MDVGTHYGPKRDFRLEEGKMTSTFIKFGQLLIQIYSVFIFWLKHHMGDDVSLLEDPSVHPLQSLFHNSGNDEYS